MNLDFAPIEGDAPFVFGPIQTKWLEALESGKFEQGRGQLKDGKRFCCLGVLCELMQIPWVEDDTNGHGYKEVAPEFTTNGNMPSEVSQQVGFRDDIGGFKMSREIRSPGGPMYGWVGSLVGCNDLAKMSFKEIAELIRYDPYNVFNIPA